MTTQVKVTPGVVKSKSAATPPTRGAAAVRPARPRGVSESFDQQASRLLEEVQSRNVALSSRVKALLDRTA